MNWTRLALACVWSALVGCADWAPAAQPVGLESLLREMIHRDHLAQFPDPAYTCRQFSSYDRETVAPDQPGWFANWDRSQFVRVEETQGRKEWVMMDAQGPGAVVHIWGTWHGPGGGPFSNGMMRVYLDGNPQPAIAGPVADLISGGALVPAPFSESVSPQTAYERRGHNLYLPIPYAKSCKITYESDKLTDIGGKQGDALYYQINYRTYAPGTEVVTFDRGQLAPVQSLLQAAGKRLVESGLQDDADLQATDFHGLLEPGQRRSCELKGPRAIRRLVCRLEADQLPQALRSTVLELAFDGQPSVWCPLGDFFGIGYQVHAYRTYYSEASADGLLTSYWVMPFERSCRIMVHNLGQQPVTLAVAKADTSLWNWDDRSLHFHTTWRQYTKLDTGPNKDQTGNGAFDVNYVQVQGRGVYVGDTLTLFNGTAAWWGEGDEKIWVDGESFPSHVGTGTEDYYGYAWCRPESFSAPFHAQPTGAGNLAGGYSVNSRYRGLDAIPFTTALKFDMEMWHWRATRINFAPTAFWYARPGATPNVAPDRTTAALPVALRRSDIIEMTVVPGAVEGEALRVAEKSGGVTEVQSSDQFSWSGDQQLWWRDGKPGDRLVLEVPVEQAGTYRVQANLTKARDYGQVRIVFNGKAAAKNLDRYATAVAHDLVELGEFTLQAGVNRLEVEIVGAHEKALPRHMFGLDYLKLEKTP